MGGHMYTHRILICIVCLISCCLVSQAQYKRIQEDGVEVVINGPQPNTIENRIMQLSLEPDLVIDMEEQKFARLALRDLWMFNVDAQGNIFLWDLPLTKADIVYKLDPEGNFITSFLKHGQGPGEVQSPSTAEITSDNELMISDFFPRKLLYFDLHGIFLREERLDERIGGAYTLRSSHYFVLKTRTIPGSNNRESLRTICDDSFQETMILTSKKLQDLRTAERINGITADESFLLYAVSRDKIYLGDNEKEIYEILCFDLEGDLIRKIRKIFTPVKVTEEFKKKKLAPYEKPANAMMRSVRNRLYFPNHFPPYQNMFCDDEGHLFVMTYETGKNRGEYLWDIFDDEGRYLGKVGIGNYGIWERRNPGQLKVKAKNQRLYCILIKENGFKELIRYRMEWENRTGSNE
jgi:hypothetical protein